MVFHLFDSSALLKRYKTEPGSAVVERIFSHPRSRAFLPNICIPEMLTVFSAMHYGTDVQKGALTKAQADTLSASFLADVRERRIYPYDLIRAHIVKADLVIAESFQVKATGQRQRIDTVDSLVVSMALEMHLIYKGNVTLVSADEHQLKTARRLKLQVVNPAIDTFQNYLKKG